MESPRIYFSDEACCIAFWNNVVLTDVSGDMNVARMRMIGKAYRSLLERYPDIVALGLLRPGVPVSNAEARAESHKLMKDVGTHVQVCMLIEAEGVMAQMLRSIIRGINVLTRNTSMSIAENIDDAIRLVAPRVDTDTPRERVGAELKQAVAIVRAGFQSSAGLRS